MSPSSVAARAIAGLPTEGPEVEAEARTADDLVLYVIIPQSEQYKIPVWADIKILMTIDWTSTKFGASYKTSKKVFQNAMYTIKFAPVDSYLIPNVKSNYKFVQKS